MDYTERKKIGILFYYGKNWMGGVIYIINLIKSINKLPDAQKPIIILFYNDSSKPFINEINYPYLTMIYRVKVNEYTNYLFSVIKGKNCFEDGLIDQYQLDGLFPLNDFPCKLGKNNSKVAAWYPDLQHKFYPQYFTKTKRFFREWRLKQIIKNASNIVLSSNDVFCQFNQFYTLKANMNFHILRFTSIVDNEPTSCIEELKCKYNIDGQYFIVSNQFWPHKNHKIVFEALNLLKKNNVNCKIVFTGNMMDKKNPKYIDGLKQMIVDFELQDLVCFVGLINREEQLCLMKNSLAVIQPSLFEGWSTVIEDAKALKCQIIASNLNVHKEQLEDGKFGYLFDSHDANSLTNILKGFISHEIELKPTVDNYNELILHNAKQFVSIFPDKNTK
ncbi:MAG: glycosyltransferase family 1 protein [Bacteroidota bacterium]|nr:glycosyltransferase family 1 protein [Bacteroidota bacterium]